LFELWIRIFGEEEEAMAAVTKQRQPPVGYPTGGEVKEEQAPQVVDDNTDKAQQNGEDDGETDRGISPGFIIGRRYSGPVLYDYSGRGSKYYYYYSNFLRFG
jgi:hypothetical protein